MNAFEKVFMATIGVGFSVLGFLCGILALKIVFEVLGIMLGSTVGSILLLAAILLWYKYKKEVNQSKN